MANQKPQKFKVRIEFKTVITDTVQGDCEADAISKVRREITWAEIGLNAEKVDEKAIAVESR